MIITTEWHDEQFNVLIASKEGAEPFLTVKGCRLASGSKGPFVSWPATKNQNTGKWWQHVWASDKFAAVVLSKAQESQPRQQGGQREQPSDDSIPF